MSRGEKTKEFKHCIRLTEEVENIILGMKGDNFNEKLDNLCLKWQHDLSDREKKIKVLDKRISEREDFLEKLNAQIKEKENILGKFRDFMYYIESAAKTVKSIT